MADRPALPLKWFYGITFGFLALVLYFLSREQYWAAVLPLVLGILLLSIYALDVILLSIAFFTPVAIVLNDKSVGPALSMPTEPLLFGVLLITLLKIIQHGGFDRKVLYHPVSLAIFFMLGWKTLTCLTSSLPVVSLKHLLSQFWFIIPMYLLEIGRAHV